TLLTIWISLETMALASYVLAGYFKRERRSNEAALTYFILGALSSGVLLYGISLLYGAAGTVQLSDLAEAHHGWAVPEPAPTGESRPCTPPQSRVGQRQPVSCQHHTRPTSPGLESPLPAAATWSMSHTSAKGALAWVNSSASPLECL
ncbi:hypothetical protein B4Q13_24460, partial [Lacticaseibacillus rhamnosus]